MKLQRSPYPMKFDMFAMAGFIFMLFVLLLFTNSNIQAQWKWGKNISPGHFEFYEKFSESHVAVDQNGNTYVAGTFKEAIFTVTGDKQSPDIFVVKFDPQGNVVWATSFGSVYMKDIINSGNDFVRDIKVDSYGNVFISGSFHGEIIFNKDTVHSASRSLPPQPMRYEQMAGMYLAKLSPVGSKQWIRSVDDIIGIDYSDGYGIIPFSDGSIAFLGFQGSGGYFGTTKLEAGSVFVKYSISGDIILAKNVLGGKPFCVSTDGSENFYLSSYSGNDKILHKYTSSGTLVWVNPLYTSVKKVIVEPNGRIFYAATEKTLIKFDTSGILWQKDPVSQTNNFAIGDIELNSAGDLLVSGNFHTLADFGSGFVLQSTGAVPTHGYLASYKSDGSIEWVVKQTAYLGYSVNPQSLSINGDYIAMSGTSSSITIALITDLAKETVFAVNPAQMLQGNKSTVTIDGYFEVGKPGSLLLYLENGSSTTNPVNLTIKNPMRATAEISIPEDAPHGTWIVWLQRGSEKIRTGIEFTVASLPRIITATPSTLLSGEKAILTIDAIAANFAGVTKVWLERNSNQIIADEFTIGASLKATFSIPASAEAGQWSVHVARTGDSIRPLKNAVEIQTTGEGTAPNWNWAQQITSSTANDRSYGLRVAFDREGNIYSAGTFGKKASVDGIPISSQGSSDIFISSYKPDSSLRWTKTFGGFYDETVEAVRVDKSGNVYLAGNFQQEVTFGSVHLKAKGGIDAYITKLDSSGNILWAKAFGGSASDVAVGLELDTDQNIVMAGNFTQSIDFPTGKLTSKGLSDIYIVKLLPDGDCLWAKQDGANNDDYAVSLKLNKSNEIYIAGNYDQTTTLGGSALSARSASTDIFLSRYSDDGAGIWAKSYGSDEMDAASGLSVDASGNALVTGTYLSTAYFDDLNSTAINQSQDAFLAKVSALGEVMWVKSFGTAQDDDAPGVAVDHTGSIYSIGHYKGSLSWGNAQLLSNQLDLFVGKLTSTGSFVWARSTNVKADAVVSVKNRLDMAIDDRGCIAVTGTFGTEALIGDNVLKSPKEDAFIAYILGKLQPNNIESFAPKTVDPFTVGYNQELNTLLVYDDFNNTHLVHCIITDIIGKELFSQPVTLSNSVTTWSLDLDNIVVTNGFYLCTITSNSYSKTVAIPFLHKGR